MLIRRSSQLWALIAGVLAAVTPAWTASVQDGAASATQATATQPAPADAPDPTPETVPEAAPDEVPPEPPAEPPDIHVSPEGRVQMHVRALDLGSVLQMLSMQSRRNIVASKKVTGVVTASLYDVTFAEALTAILSSNGAAWREQGNFVYVYTNEELAALELAGDPPETRLFRLHYSRAADVQAMITPLLSRDGKITVPPPAAIGLATSKEQAGGDTITQEEFIVISDHPDRLESIARLIDEIDTRPRQVMIEATILRALLNEDNALGVDFNVVGGVDFQNLGSSSSGGTEITVGDVPPGQLQKTTISANTDFRDQVPSGGLTFGLIHNNIATFVRALEQVTDTTVLANPKVLALNKQRGEVVIGRRDGYLTTTVTQTAAVQTVEFLETGTRLIFRPFIGDDGYIRMEVHPEDSTGGVTASNLPFEQTTEVTTNILVRDGHTILIGGLFRETTKAGRGQLPVLGNIPIAGALFRNSQDTTGREEIIILLTVRLIKDDRALDEASAKAVNDVERYRVGMRQGLLWFGRERLAQAHYRWAVEHLNKGHVSKALWDLDLAINNNPKFLAAIQLKEDLLCRREWDEDNSSVRDFVQRQIEGQNRRPEVPFGRPDPSTMLPELHGPNGFEEGGSQFGPPPAPAAEKGGAR